MDHWRSLLYYPLGLLPSLFFTLRILIQWIQSERRQSSYVGKAFWRLSLAGNLLLLLHYTFQVQYPFALIQAGNAFISWRNLNLMKSRPTKTTSTLALLFLSLLITTLLFLAQSHFLIGEIDWIRTPTKPNQLHREHHALVWHLIGTIGAILFASRFWIQWWMAEKLQQSTLTPTFWWISIVGSLLCLVYFIEIRDTVSILNYSFGLIPYFRNLMLITKSSRQSTVQSSKAL